MESSRPHFGAATQSVDDAKQRPRVASAIPEGTVRKHQVGMAIVAGAPPELNCTPPVSDTGDANGCEPRDCEQAKKNAMANLVGRMRSEECKRYVEPSPEPCRKWGC